MSSEVETARAATNSQCSSISRIRFAPLGTTKRLFARLDIYYDVATHLAAENMAIDEALLETAVVPTIRFYRWRSPALSFGYFGKFSDVAVYAAERDLVRRWTGGGIVFHGDDLTYSIVIPVTDPVVDESSVAIYEKIHRALCEALNSIGTQAVVAGGVDPGRTCRWDPSRRQRQRLQLLRESGSRRRDDKWPKDRRSGTTPYSPRFVAARQHSRVHYEKRPRAKICAGAVGQWQRVRAQ